jgi:hypothetical protein
MLKFVLANDAVTCVIPATGNRGAHEGQHARGRRSLADKGECEQIRKLFA